MFNIPLAYRARASQSEVIDVEVPVDVWNSNQKRRRADTVEESTSGGKLLSPAEREAQKYAEMHERIKTTVQRAFDMERMIK